MCGIAGYVGRDDPSLLRRMAGRMVHRGPDDEGFWWDATERVGLAHRRLSIIDTSDAGHQPMTTGNGQVQVSFNGEIYNFLDHRRRLESKGVRFRGHSDTEVLLHLYLEKGLDALPELDGMFAVAIWDARCRRLLLARDHAGVKPLYYWMDRQSLLFASEIKALLEDPGVPNQLNTNALADYLTLLWVPGSETLLRDIRKLEPGHYLTWEQGRVETHCWFRLDYEPEPGRSDLDWADEVRAAVIAAVGRQMVSDVPLGAFLSGGLDSSSIVAAMRAAHPDRPITVYSARSSSADAVAEQGGDDAPFASRVADFLHADLRFIDIEPDVIRLLPRMVYHLDEPDADPAIFPSYLVAMRARDEGTKVLLSGTGGDEVFFGYRSHQAFDLSRRLGPLHRPIAGLCSVAGRSLGSMLGAQHRWSRRLSKLAPVLSAGDRLSRHMATVDWAGPRERAMLLGTGRVSREIPAGIAALDRMFSGNGELNYHSHVLIGSFLAAHNFLYTDKSSMAASLEVRVPFTDVALMRLAARIPESAKFRGGVTKRMLKLAMEPMLPRDVIYRSKVGFGAPLRRWIRGELSAMVTELLDPVVVTSRGILSPSGVRRLVEDNASGRADHAYAIYALLNLEIWLRTFIDQRAVLLTT